SGPRPSGRTESRAGISGRCPHEGNHQQDHAHPDQHAEDGCEGVGGDHRGRPCTAAFQLAREGRESELDRRLRGQTLMARLRIGSRGSQLALWQANHISALLRDRGHEVEIEIIKTTGDKITDVALAKVGTKGMFTKEIEEALAEARVDLAVHSLKDLPTELPHGFEIAAITERQDPRDAFCSRRFASVDDLPNGARIGTSSLRRQAQLKAIRPDLEIYPLRGNVDTRLRKLEQGEY